MLEDYSRLSELFLLNSDIKRGSSSGGITQWVRVYSILEWCPWIILLMLHECLSFHSLFGRRGPVLNCLHHMFSHWCMLWLLTYTASKINLQTTEFGQTQKPFIQFEPSWIYSHSGKRTEVYKMSLFFLTKFWSKIIYIQKLQCLNEFLLLIKQNQTNELVWL